MMLSVLIYKLERLHDAHGDLSVVMLTQSGTGEIDSVETGPDTIRDRTEVWLCEYSSRSPEDQKLLVDLQQELSRK